jgi:hypothetical protein
MPRTKKGQWSEALAEFEARFRQGARNLRKLLF